MARQLYSKPTLLCKTVPLFLGPHPGVRCSRRRKPGHRSLGTAAHQGKALAVEGCTSREVGATRRRTSHLCDPTRVRAEKRKAHPPPSTAGWIPQGGGRPRLWRFFPRFLIVEKSGPAERPHQAGKPEPASGQGQHAIPYTLKSPKTIVSGLFFDEIRPGCALPATP